MAKPRARGKHPGGRPRVQGSARRDVQVAVRLDAQMVGRLDAIVDRSSGVLQRATVVRAAIRLGLATLETDPGALLRQADDE